mmetsp:Transcript_100870/g.159028  ORF Transcript_100870/g.159028 Transcript_100870/m.159028 type:complete len:719 (+) Transcript_100870:115-2271(+)
MFSAPAVAGAGACGFGCGMLLQEALRRLSESGGSRTDPKASLQKSTSSSGISSAKMIQWAKRASASATTSNYVNIPFKRTLKDAWVMLDVNGDGELSQEEFVDTCIIQLHFDLSEAELIRIFKSADADGNGVLTQSEFMNAIVGKAFFSNLVSLAGKSNSTFQVKVDYNFDVSTNDNYKETDTTLFYGKYSSIRTTLDYGYHVNYTKERQEWQDSVISQVSERTAAQSNPWIVFTCGPMGAGKGYALSWMSTRGYFPIEGMVHVDPDYFKSRMPEFKGYIERKKEAGTMCHRESAFMQEIAQETAMQSRQHVWIDGSLKDAGWFGQVFDGIRKRYPHYRIAIFYVWASEDIVRERCADRARKTGRAIPEELMQASLQEPKDSLAALIPKADFVARIANNSTEPHLEAVETIDRSHSWAVIQKHFANPDVQAHEFPNHLLPLTLQTSPDVLHQCLTISRGGTNSKRTTFELDVGKLGPDILAAWSQISSQTKFELTGSAVHHTPINPDMRKNRGLCEAAATQAWIYESGSQGLGSTRAVQTGWASNKDLSAIIDTSSSFMSPGSHLRSESTPLLESAWEVATPTPTPQDRRDAKMRFQVAEEIAKLINNFLLGGGFVYFDKDGGIAQMQFHATKNSSSLDLISRMQFDSRVDMPPQIVEELKRKNRWASPNIDFFLKRGVTSYAWCVPGEVICGHVMPPSGAFAFLFGNGQALYFPVLE